MSKCSLLSIRFGAKTGQSTSSNSFIVNSLVSDSDGKLFDKLIHSSNSKFQFNLKVLIIFEFETHDRVNFHIVISQSKY